MTDDSYPYPDYPRTHLNGGAPWVKGMEALEARIAVLERAVFPNGQARIMPPPEKAQPRADYSGYDSTRMHDPDAQITRNQARYIEDICRRSGQNLPPDLETWTRKQASEWIDANKGRKATA